MPNKDLAAAADAVDTLNVALEQDLEHVGRDDLVIPDLPPAEYRQPWDRQEGESDEHYKQFRYYLDQGLARKVKDVAERFGLFHDQKRRVSSAYRTSSKREWKRRASLWDTEQERLYQLARSEAIRDMVHRHEGQIEKAIDGLMAPIAARNHAMETDGEFVAELSKTDKRKLISLANQAARTIPSLMSAERLARGMPTEIVDGVIEHEHIVSVERNQIGEVLEILAGAGRLDAGGDSFGTGEIVDAEVVDVHPVSAETDE